MGSLPPALLKYATGQDASAATSEFNNAITSIASDFHDQLDNGIAPENIKPHTSEIFGLPVRLDYVASGSVGSVYKMQIGDEVFALKINRNASAGEMEVIAEQSRAPNLINKMYLGQIFEHAGRKYSWVLSDYIANDSENSFSRAMEKLYYAYLTKGVSIVDSHPNNFKGGKLIDQASFTKRTGKIDDIKQLTRIEVDKVKKLVYYIKTDNVSEFQKLIEKISETNPAVVKYMFFAMKFGKSPVFSNRESSFAAKLKKFETIVNTAYRAQNNLANVLENKKQYG